MEEKICRQCAHFRQHYAVSEGRVFRVYCGHCVVAKPRRKRPDAKGCAQFTPGEKDTDVFADKEYLTKALLRYVMEMELFPKITDDRTDIYVK